MVFEHIIEITGDQLILILSEIPSRLAGAGPRCRTTSSADREFLASMGIRLGAQPPWFD